MDNVFWTFFGLNIIGAIGYFIGRQHAAIIHQREIEELFNKDEE